MWFIWFLWIQEFSESGTEEESDDDDMMTAPASKTYSSSRWLK